MMLKLKIPKIYPNVKNVILAQKAFAIIITTSENAILYTKMVL